MNEWEFEGVESQTAMADITITEDESINVIKELNVNKSSAIDFVSTKVFKTRF